MRVSFHLALLLAFLAVITFLVVSQTLVLRDGLREDFIGIQESELARELDLAPLILEAMDTVDPDSAASVLAREIGYPVTFLNEEGLIVGASSELPFQRRGIRVSPESPEIRAALQGDVGFSRRRGPDEVEIRLFAATPAALGGERLILQVAVPLDEIDRAVGSRIRNSLGLFVPASILALVLVFLLGRVVSRPLKTVERRSRALAAGNFQRRIPRPFRVKEMDELAASFNRLSDELQNRYQSLQGERDEMQALIDYMGEAVIALDEAGLVLRTNRAAIGLLDLPDPVPYAPIGTLVRHPSLRALLEDAVDSPFTAREISLGDKSLLVSARGVDGGGAVVTFLDVSEIRRLEMVRRDFVANASHELKTPLTAMRGFAETLVEDDPPEDLRKSFLNSIRANTLRLQNLVDDLLDLSRLESGGWVAVRTEVELASAVKEVWSQFRGPAQERGLEFSLAGEALVWADEQGLAQIIQNLIHNAIQYSPDGGSLHIQIEGEDPWVRMEVRDTGIGILTSALPRIFERFFRVDPARSRAGGGTGLGLAIVRHLAEAMGGQVWAESELGQGTSIFLTLPKAPEEGEG